MKTAVKWKFLASLMMLFMLTAVGTCKPDPPGPVVDVCDQACDRGTSLGCTWAAPTTLGATCGDTCRSAKTILPWNTACIITAVSCAAADACQAK
jgi:hypothetical protein